MTIEQIYLLPLHFFGKSKMSKHMYGPRLLRIMPYSGCGFPAYIVRVDAQHLPATLESALRFFSCAFV